MTSTLKIATRKSPLALWQANYVSEQLKKHHPEIEIELVMMVTQGDKILDTPLAKIGGKGLFVKELELALLDGRADLAVHSMKDVPMDFPPGLELAVICPRENPFDAFVSNNYKNLSDLPKNAVVGTSSLRRQSQIKAARPDLEIKDLRGNVGTRLGKLDAGNYDAIILAAAGLIRLQQPERIASILSEDLSLPAVGQGAVGIEIRSDDGQTLSLLKPLHCDETAIRVTAERAMNKHLNGGCQVPIAGFAEISASQLQLRGRVASTDGSKLLEEVVVGNLNEAEEIGIEVAEKLLTAGAEQILSEIYP